MSNIDFNQQNLITKSKLIERGWTESLITKFLPNPDQIKLNPHYKKAAPMKLFLLDRIQIIENTDQFKIAKENSAARKTAAKKAVSTKTAKIMNYVELNVDIVVPKIEKNKLISLACNSFNDWQFNKNNSDGILATPKSDELFLQRICVNFIRHEMTDYEFHLGEVFGKVGTANAYFAIREKIFTAIAKEYPWLKSECERQSN